jgi:hypothetical protein
MFFRHRRFFQLLRVVVVMWPVRWPCLLSKRIHYDGLPCRSSSGARLWSEFRAVNHDRLGCGLCLLQSGSADVDTDMRWMHVCSGGVYESAARPSVYTMSLGSFHGQCSLPSLVAGSKWASRKTCVLLTIMCEGVVEDSIYHVRCALWELPLLYTQLL